MKTEERELIQSLLAPLASLATILAQDRQQLAALLAPLAVLPDAVRALARAQAQEPHATYEVSDIADVAGLDRVPGEDLAGVLRRVRERDWTRAMEHARAEVRPTHAELSEMYASGARDGRGQVWRAAGLDGDPPNDASAIVAAIQEQASARLARMLAEKERAEQRVQELQAELDVRFEEGRALGREAGYADGVVEARGLVFQRLVERSGHPAVDESVALDTLACAIRDGLDAGASLRDVRERAQRSVLLDVLDQVEPGARHEVVPVYVSAHCAVDSLPLPEFRAEVVRRWAGVRERAARGALLALLDERCPGARHERTGLGKVEDLPAVELRAEIARRVGERPATDAQDERPGLLAALRAFGGRADEGCETWTVDGLRLACANLGQAYRRMEDQCSVQVTKDVYDGLVVQRDAYMQQVFDLDQHLRAALDTHEVDHTGADALRCLELLIASRDAQAKTLDEAESAYDRGTGALAAAQDTIATLDRTLRAAVRGAGVSVEDATVIEIAERLVLVASNNHTSLIAIDAELRRFLQTCGEKFHGTTLDLVRRLADAGQRTVVEVPRSARDGARRELREIVSALGLRVEIDHLSLPEARAAVVRAVQEQTTDRDATAEFERSAWQTLGLLCGKLGVWFDFASLVPPLDQGVTTIARVIREHYVNVRHEDLARGQRLVIDAVCALFQLPVPPADVAAQTWAEQLWKEHLVPAKSISAIVGRDSGEDRAVGADTASEQRASVLAAVHALGGELPSQPTLGEACVELDSRIYSLTTWAKDNLPLVALWDAQLVVDCPLAFERVKRSLDSKGVENPARDMSEAHEDSGDWNPLARDLRAIAEGDDASGLVNWLKTGCDFRNVLDVVLDRVKHLEEECAKSDDNAEAAKNEIADRVEDLARALYERLPLGVHPQLVVRCAQDLDRVDDPLVNGVRTLLAGAAGRAHDPRTLEDWCALHPTERNRLIDRTRDALAAVAA